MGIGVDNTALGDAVNVAFRLESATKVLGKDIVLSETAYRHLPEKFWKPLTQKIRVKGKRDPVRIFAVDFTDVPMLLQAIKRNNK